MNKKPYIVAGIIIGLMIFISSGTFVLPQATQAVVTQFGKPVRTITTPGLHYKLPFIQKARYVDKRILSWDGTANTMPTKDKKYIDVDTTARWQITDALKFIQTAQSEQGAVQQLNSVLDSATHTVIASHNLIEVVRNTNDIMKRMEDKKKENENEDEIDEEVYSDIEKVIIGREKLSTMIKTISEKELVKYGIRLVDVQFRRIAYQEAVESKVFERMISERNRIAEKIRAIGSGESAKIRGKMQKDLNKIESESYKTVQEIRGEADAKALKVYAATFSKNPELYEFLKSIEGYKKVFKSDKETREFIISPDSPYFKHLKAN